MRSIKPLPEAVRSSLRSGIILYDLTRVVEELVFNSLDAGATKVYVAVGVGTCSAKVVDNGSGIDRDGLVLLGERYASSRYDHLAGLDTGGSFGFRGEALCSIADVSLVEIVTKAQGMPHGYRKIMKGCKCLYLGIDDGRRDVGTTVVVRDLFYNQPVRRKHMQCSPKKVLHSIKKSILRIALVHSKVAFRVDDTESDDELLRTGSSPSPLQLLSRNFGVEDSGSLNELEACQGELKLSGYISGPLGISSQKAFQYIYINSRFVCKGPIHKLLNQLSASYWDKMKFNIGTEHEKQSRSQICPMFILNLSCPRCLYDLTFETSKNSVDFKDWGPILVFFQNAANRIWTERISDDLQANLKNRRKRCRTQKWQASLEVPSSEHQKLTNDCNHLPAWRGSSPSCQKSNGDASELRKHQTESLFIHDTGDASQPCYTSVFHCEASKRKKNGSHSQSSQNILSAEDNFWVRGCNTAKISNKQLRSFLGSKCKDESFEEDEKMGNVSTGYAVSTDFQESSDDADASQDFQKTAQPSCLTPGSLPQCQSSFSNEVGFGFKSDDFTIQQKWIDHGQGFDIGEAKDVDQILKGSFSRQDEQKFVWSVSRCSNLYQVRANSNVSSRDMKSSLISDKCLDEEKYLLPDSVKYISSCSPSQHLSTPECKWKPLVSSPLLDTKFQDVDHFTGENDLEAPVYNRGTRYTYFTDEEEDCKFTFDRGVDNWGADDCSISSCVDFSYDNSNAFFWGEDGKSRGHQFKGPLFPSYSQVFADEMDWWHLPSCHKISHPDFSDPLLRSSLSGQSDRNKYREIERRNQLAHSHKNRARRSLSAPPLYKHRKKYVSLNNSVEMAYEKTDFPSINSNLPLPEISSKHPQHSTETSNMNHRKQLFNPQHMSLLPNYVDDPFSIARMDRKRTNQSFEIQNRPLQSQRYCINSCILDSVKDLVPKEIEDILESEQKWQGCCPETVSGVKSHNVENQNTVLDISSGILHLAGDSLVPSSIDKNSLKDARVLQQVDKKFIPVIAGRTLAIIDQHAADERIRLEELRQKVLSGEMKEITRLESEHELVLPEIGYQLLHNYAEQIQNWGWICHINGEGSRSFRKNLNVLHRQPTIAKLIAVPCILGVNLTDADLLEFLQQLADTDGSSTIPPSVNRVLNNKACRGAIMFGDILLPSECSLIVEELKRTLLCFQCAHGRPTTVPLVNLEALHKQIRHLGMRGSGTDELWHGLRRREISLGRAACRLNSAID